jgi:serine/threonine-protein kinase
MAERIGARIAGRYELEKPLGRGGMAEVWQARHLALNARVAIKLLHAATANAATSRQRFVTEAQLTAQIKGRHAVQVFDFGVSDDGQPFLVMELLEGETLAQRLRRERRLDPRTTVRFLTQSARALDRAHALGIVHRDYKPENLFIVRDDDGLLTAKVVDFGIAKLVGGLDPHDGREEIEGREPTLTTTGTRLGTPAYMAPEQIDDVAAIGPATDVWALGVVAFECLTGRRPFEARDVHGIFERIQAVEHPPARVLDRMLPEEFDAWFATACARRPEQRFASAGAAAHALALALGLSEPSDGPPPANDEPVLETPPDAQATMSATFADPPRARRRRPLAIAVAVAVLAAGSAMALRRRTAGPAPLVVSASGVTSVSAAPPAPRLTVRGAPVVVDAEGDCASFPFFAADGGLVYARRTGDRESLQTIDPGTAESRTLVECPTGCRFPAPGPDGRVAFGNVDPAGREIRSVGLFDAGTRSEAPRAWASWFQGKWLFVVREDLRAISRHAVDGSGDDTLFEAPSAGVFGPLAVSPDGHWIAASVVGTAGAVATSLCYATSAPGSDLDCTSAGQSTSRRPTFSAGGGLYFGRRNVIARFDPATKTTEEAPLPLSPVSLGLAPDGHRLVFSTCADRHELTRLSESSGAPLLSIEAVGAPAIGPHGELAYPVVAGDDVELAVADPSGARSRVLVAGHHRITEASFSPDGKRLVFQDAAPVAGGLYVVAMDGARPARRITTEPRDSSPAWLDAGHVVFLRAEAGFPYGRMKIADVETGAVEALPNGDVGLFGTVPSRRTILAIDSRTGEDRFFEQALDGTRRPFALTGARSRGRATTMGASVSGRYVTWLASDGAFLADLDTKVARRLAIDATTRINWILPDDEGRVVVVQRRGKGALYRIEGDFR